MAIGYRTPVFDVRREGFPSGPDGDRQFREFQNFTQKLNRFVADMVLMREKLVFETEIAEPDDDTGVNYIYIDSTDHDLYIKYADNVKVKIANKP